MFVIIDLEWLSDRNNASYLTQISAVRANKTWEPVDRFDAICMPTKGVDLNNYVALSGYNANEFASAPLASDVVKNFACWLESEDVLLFWHWSSWSCLKEFAGRYSITLPTNKKQYLGDKVRAHYMRARGNSYELCAFNGLNAPYPEHCSKNDVAAILLLLQHSQLDMTAKPIIQTAPKPQPSRQERNREIILRTEYNYLYAENSGIFHKRGCACMLNAKLVLGSVYYESASKNRVPCKHCRPDEDIRITRTAKKSKSKLCESVSRELRARKAESNACSEQYLITGEWAYLKKKNIVGCCHYAGHPGKLTKDLMHKHDCINKNCRHFEKYEGASYWEYLELLRKQKEKKRVEKEQAAIEAQELDSIKSTLKSYISSPECSMEIIRVERQHSSLFKVFYVSDNPFADSNRFPGFIDRVRRNHPSWRLILKHIKNEEGRFVTREEFRSRVRK